MTQATVSRDIKELQLIKVQANSGAYKYAENKKHKTNDMDIMMRIFKDTVLSVDFAENLVVIKTLSGSANAAEMCIRDRRRNVQDFESFQRICQESRGCLQHWRRVACQGNRNR